MRKIKTKKNKPQDKKKNIKLVRVDPGTAYEQKKKSLEFKFHQTLIRTATICATIDDFIQEHRKLWDKGDAFLKPYLKGQLTGAHQGLSKFVEKYGDERIISSKHEYNKGVLYAALDNHLQADLLELNKGKIDNNYNLFETFLIIQIGLKCLRLGMNDLVRMHRKAKEELDPILYQINLYSKWWCKEVDEFELRLK